MSDLSNLKNSKISNGMNIVAIIQARMGSTRLPGKVLMDIAGKPMLWHVVNRLKYSRLLNKIIVATSISKKDDVIEKKCKELNVECFRGSEEDVLERYYEASKHAKANIIVRITADCPFVDPLIMDKIIKIHLKNKNDYTMNNAGNTYPRGTDIEVFNFKSLEKTHQNANKSYQKEHVSLYIYEHPQAFKIEILEAKGILRRPKLRFCVDTKEDLKAVRAIYTMLCKSRKLISTYNVIKLLDCHPELTKINAHVKQKN